MLIHFREKGCLVEGPLDNLQICTVQLTKMQPRKEKHYDDTSNRQFDMGMGMGVDMENQTFNQGFDMQNFMSFQIPGTNMPFFPGLDPNNNDFMSYANNGNWNFGNFANPYPTSNNPNLSSNVYQGMNRPLDSNYAQKLDNAEKSQNLEGTDDTLTQGFSSLEI